MKIAGIPRNPSHSPNMSDKDMQLFYKIIEALKNEGHSVDILDEKNEIPQKYDAIFHMSRSAATLEKLSKCEENGVYVTNSVEGVRNCSREIFVKIFKENNIRQPRYTHINISAGNHSSLQYPGWLKKGEGWSCNADDILFAAREEDYKSALITFTAKNCHRAIFCEHITGDIVKFYGIQSENYFRWYYPNPSATKFGLEQINGVQQKYKFNTEELHATATRAAKALNINIYGGDCIITPKGEIYIIDLNDFPSFSTFCDEAAKIISTSIIKKG